MKKLKNKGSIINEEIKHTCLIVSDICHCVPAAAWNRTQGIFDTGLEYKSGNPRWDFHLQLSVLNHARYSSSALARRKYRSPRQSD
ncbi:hypothetical protein, partial [Faecalibaculum rodentium]|uniref:hypothetical protein n=1 Tax=Faecalibaculum rodentium TaxID=1702221 RepID=UPI0026243F53